MRNERDLKEILQGFARNNFQPAGTEDLSGIIPDMLAHIGSIDSSLRDDLIYSAFGTWILRHNALNREQLRGLLPKVLNDRHMLYKIGEQGTDSVFRRSFSVLLLPLLLIANRSQPFITAPEIRQIKEKLLYYLGHEKDRRGFVEGRGWAHAVAHAADALDDLAQCLELDKSDLTELLDAIRDVVCKTDLVYSHLEDERLATAVLAILKRDLLPSADIAHWIEGFAGRTAAVTSSPERHRIRANVKNFLQSLYFRLRWEKITDALDAPIDRALRTINPFATPEDG